MFFRFGARGQQKWPTRLAIVFTAQILSQIGRLWLQALYLASVRYVIILNIGIILRQNTYLLRTISLLSDLVSEIIREKQGNLLKGIDIWSDAAQSII